MNKDMYLPEVGIQVQNQHKLHFQPLPSKYYPNHKENLQLQPTNSLVVRFLKKINKYIEKSKHYKRESPLT